MNPQPWRVRAAQLSKAQGPGAVTRLAVFLAGLNWGWLAGCASRVSRHKIRACGCRAAGGVSAMSTPYDSSRGRDAPHRNFGSQTWARARHLGSWLDNIRHWASWLMAMVLSSSGVFTDHHRSPLGLQKQIEGQCPRWGDPCFWGISGAPAAAHPSEALSSRDESQIRAVCISEIRAADWARHAGRAFGTGWNRAAQAENDLVASGCARRGTSFDRASR